MKKDWTVTVEYFNMEYEKIIILAQEVVRVDNTTITVDDIPITFNLGWIVDVEKGCKI